MALPKMVTDNLPFDLLISPIFNILHVREYICFLVILLFFLSVIVSKPGSTIIFSNSLDFLSDNSPRRSESWSSFNINLNWNYLYMNSFAFV